MVYEATNGHLWAGELPAAWAFRRDDCAPFSQALPAMMQTISYRTGNDLDLDAVIELYRASTLGERRPVDDQERMGEMLRRANLVISAWEGGLLVGIARSLSDFTYCTYLSDLAVRVSHQRRGIGRELIRLTRQAGGRATIILLAAPKAVDYYTRIGFTGRPSAWTLGAEDQLQ